MAKITERGRERERRIGFASAISLHSLKKLYSGGESIIKCVWIGIWGYGTFILMTLQKTTSSA